MKKRYKILLFILSFCIFVGVIFFYLKYRNEQLPSFPEYDFKSVKNSATSDEQRLLMFLKEYEDISNNIDSEKIKSFYSKSATFSIVRLKHYGLRKNIEIQNFESFFKAIKSEIVLREMIFKSKKQSYELKNKDYLISSNRKYALIICKEIEKLYIPISKKIRDEVYNETKDENKYSKGELDKIMNTKEVTMEFVTKSAILIDISNEPYKIIQRYSILPI